MANKNEKVPTSGSRTGLSMNLIKNDGAAWLYIIPRAGKSVNSAIVDRWNYPVRRFTLENYDFLGLSFTKEMQVRQSTEGFPCLAMDEEVYYEVNNSISST